MPLTDIAVRNAKADTTKTLKLKDERGLYLEIPPRGSKRWRLRYWIKSKENRLSLGVYPEVSLKEARELRDEARKLIAKGIDPSAVRKGEVAQATEEATTFELVARQWHEKFTPSWTPGHAARILTSLEKDAFPWIGPKAIRSILPPEVLSVARRVESRGAVETAHRLVGNIGMVFRYAVASGLADSDPTRDLRGALSPTNEKHHASITEPGAVGELLRTIDTYKGSLITRCALKLAPLVFVRPGELRHAEWSEINMETKEWRIPAAKMKMRAQHIVPLSEQAVAVLEEISPLTGSGRYVFPGERTSSRPMSENTVNAALRRLGYSRDELTGHGFRSMASTLLNEQGWNRDAIERQLAHAERNNVRAAYNFAEFLPERRKMMQSWADYLDVLR
ncbi:MAG TPA: integrase arm-type DNA-binding domain-containing protein, partial [Humidesulfovibrio sp.]|uniref:tyrosine-type recombinase/integrase n=1 Tax=Humidesulfovibrio sp. TaxID=2910988 RepID=UPI002C619A5F